MIDNYVSTDFTERELISTLKDFYLTLRCGARILTQTDIPKGERLISIFTFVYQLGIEDTFYQVILDGDKVISICNLPIKFNIKNQVFKRRITMEKLDNILTLVIIIGNFIIAFINYLYGISSHDAYYMSEGIFNLIIGFGLGLLFFNKKD